MYWLTIDQIQCFQAVVECESFTKAALKLNRAKSAVIYSINNLEDQLDFKLFDRKKYRPVITPQGQSFLIKSRSVIEEMQKLQEEVKLIATGVEMRLRISASSIYNCATIYEIMQSAMKKFPTTEVLFEKETLSGKKMLEDGLVDLAIFESATSYSEFDSKFIDEVKLCLVIASDHEFFSLPKNQQTSLPHLSGHTTVCKLLAVEFTKFCG